MIKFNKMTTVERLKLRYQFEIYLQAQADGKFNMLDYNSVNEYYFNGQISRDDYLFIVNNYSEIKEWIKSKFRR